MSRATRRIRESLNFTLCHLYSGSFELQFRGLYCHRLLVLTAIIKPRPRISCRIVG